MKLTFVSTLLQNIQYQIKIYQELVSNAVKALSDCDLAAKTLYNELNVLATTTLEGNCVTRELYIYFMCLGRIFSFESFLQYNQSQ